MFDTHAHYNNPRYNEEYEGGVSAAIDMVYANGVTHIVNIGWDIESSKLASEIALKYPGRMFAAAGMHPVFAVYSSFFCSSKFPGAQKILSKYLQKERIK